MKVAQKLKLEEQTTRAEATLVQLMVESNVPLAFADKLNVAIPKMFSDSEIASSKSTLISISQNVINMNNHF